MPTPKPSFLPLPLILAALVVLPAAACSTTTADPAQADTSMPGPDPASTQSDPPATGGARRKHENDGSSSPVPSPTAAEARDFSLDPGQSIDLADGSTLRYLRVVNDSRCKPGVQCIWEGDAELAFSWDSDRFSLHSSSRGGSRSHVHGSQELTLVSLAGGPMPAAQLHVESGH